MVFDPAKTVGLDIDTNGMSFTKLTAMLGEQIKKHGLDKTAQVLWSPDNGLYVTDGLRNGIGRGALGSGIVKLGEKYLAGRDEIIRSINLSYGFALHQGKLIGEHVVEELLADRAREEAETAPGEKLSPEKLRLGRRHICIQFQDLRTLQTKIDAITDGQIEPLNESDQQRLALSVGYMRARQTHGSVAKGTAALLEAVTEDLIEHRKSKMKPSKLTANSRTHRDEAEKEAKQILYRMGMKTITQDDAEVHHLPGGLSPVNVDKASLWLHAGDVIDVNTMTMLQCTDLPRHINNGGDRLLALNNKLDQQITLLSIETARQRLSNRIGGAELVRKTKDFDRAKREIRAAVEESRSIIRELKLIPYPDGMIDWDNRQRFYDSLAGNIAKMDDVIHRLHVLLESGVFARERRGAANISKTCDIAQQHCIEAVALASAVRPLIHSKGSKRSVSRPFYLSLPGLTAYRRKDYFSRLIDRGLSYEADAPNALFEADITDEDAHILIASVHNTRIKAIKGQYKEYLRLIEAKRILFRREESAFAGTFRAKLKSAIQDNEKLTNAIRFRQKVLGEFGNKSIENEVEAAEEQRSALMFLLYPNLTNAPFDTVPLAPVSNIIAEDVSGAECHFDGAIGLGAEGQL